MTLQPRHLVAVSIVLLLAGAACTQRMEALVEDSQLGLQKTSVFDTPDPVPTVFDAAEPGENSLIGAYYSESPPLISHLTEDFLPIRIDDNMCLACHDQPDLIGEELDASDPTPIPTSHYVDLRNDPQTPTDQVVGARFICTQCHAQQANAEPLVTNTYTQ